MSNQTAELLAELKTASLHCIQRRFALLANSKRISRLVRERAVLLFAHYHAVKAAEASIDYSTDYTSSLAEINAMLADEDTDFNHAEDELLVFMSTLSKQSNNDLLVSDITSQPLNKRMIDLLFLLKDKIRITRQRLNDVGEEYDEEGYKKARNRCSFYQSVYVGQLYRDLVFCTNEEIATLEQVHYRAIEDAEGSTFVASLDETADFLETLLMAVLA